MPSYDPLSLPAGVRTGQAPDHDAVGRGIERIARWFGTPRYLGMQTAVVVAWIGVNGATGLWDEYPFKLLNLVFSTQAAYAAPMILLAQYRQDDRDSRDIRIDHERNGRALAEAEHLGREIGRIRGSLATKADRVEVQEAVDRLELAMHGYAERRGLIE